MIHAALDRFLKNCPRLSQAKLAEKAGVNRGQLSAWLKSGKNFGSDRIIAVIEVVAEWLKREGAECMTSQAQHIREITAYPPYKALQEHAWPFEPVVAGHPSYVERDAEAQLQKWVADPPFGIAVIGGPKMGKSSQLNWLEKHLRRNHLVLRAEFRHHRVAPLEAIRQATESHLSSKQIGRLDEWEQFPRWASQYLLRQERPVTLIFDQVELLGVDGFRRLQDGVHLVTNQRRSNPALDRLSLVVAYDEAHPVVSQASQDFASGMTRELRALALKNFDKTGVEHLLQTILVPHSTEESRRLTEAAWNRFHGHPYLTHLWAHLYNEEGIQDADRLPETMNDVAQSCLFRHYWDGLNEEAKAAIREALGAASGTGCARLSWPTLGRQTRLWLEDSGLFVADEAEAPGVLRFATPWIQDQLAQVIAELA